MAQKGYDTAAFAQFMEYKRVNGTNIDNWTFDELRQVVAEFIYNQQKTSYSKPKKDEDDFDLSDFYGTKKKTQT